MLTIKMDETKRNIGLDIMRGLGVIMVFCAHSLQLFEPYFPQIKLLSHLFRNGVELFFALSGFLIGKILLKLFARDKNYSFSGLLTFYKRRWFRTLPLYFLGISINLIIGYCVTGNYKDFHFLFLIFSQNTIAADFWFFPISYSLSIEEWLYLLFPVIILLFLIALKKPPLRSITLVCLLFIVVITFYRYTVFLELPHWDTHVRKAIWTRLDCSIYGVLIAILFEHNKQAFYKFKNHLFAIGLFLNILGMCFYLFTYSSILNYVFTSI